MKYSVILTGERLPGVPVLAPVLAAAFALDRDTAALRARHCWGVLASGLDEAGAVALVGKFSALNVPAARFPDEALSVPPALAVERLSFGTGVLSWSGPAGSGTERADRISVLAAAPVREDVTRVIRTKEGPSGGERALRLGLMAAGIPVGLGKSKEVSKEIRNADFVFYLDLVMAAEKRRLRVTPGHFDFSCLKEKKSYSGDVNFRLLCAELASFAPGALKNTGLLAILERGPLGGLGYDGTEDLEKETSRLCALVQGT